MKRANVLHLLKEYNPIAPEEIECKERMIAFINEHEDCFERSLEKGHITGSCWLLSRDESQALLLDHKKLNQWLQLGGHCDGDPDVLAVALKEAQEESGIMYIIPVSTKIFDIDIHPIPENPKEKAHYHYDVRFLLKVDSDEPAVGNRESKELRWITKDSNLLPTQNPSIVRMFNKWVSRD